MKKWIFYFIIANLIVDALIFRAWWYLHQPASDQAQEVIFEVEPKLSFKKMVQQLEQQGLIHHASWFEIYVRLTGKSSKLRTGEYALKTNMSPVQIFNILSSGKSIEYPLTIPEGYNKWEIADLLEEKKLGSKKEFLALVNDPKFVKDVLGEEQASLEGYLFPETYHLTKYTQARGLLKAMVKRFLDVYAGVKTNSNVRLSRHQIVILASIIEKETGADGERAQVSSVFHNRMRLKMKFQTDPTVIYGIMDSGREYKGNIHKSDLETSTRYNTYTNYGFPFGPISNPGKASLQAAWFPAETDFLYFVSRNDGTHVFSKDFKSHEKAIGKFQLDPKAREGKSWRDLKKTAK